MLSDGIGGSSRSVRPRGFRGLRDETSAGPATNRSRFTLTFSVFKTLSTR